MMGLEVDFLPVGDGEKCGDAISLRFGNLYGTRDEQTVVVIDGGFSETGEELVKHIKKYYGTEKVDLVISTHPDHDHISGLQVVLKKLQVEYLWMHLPWNHTKNIADMFKDGRVTDNGIRESLRKSLEDARELEKLANSRGITIIEPFTNISDSTQSIFVLAPTKKYYENLLPQFRGTPEPKFSDSAFEKVLQNIRSSIKRVAESWGIETLIDKGETTAENNTSVILLLIVEGRILLFTADSGIPALTNAADLLDDSNIDISKRLSFIQVPHHGSRRNVGPSILNRLIGPKQTHDKKKLTAYVSVSKNKTPKHPAKKVTNAFRRRGAYVYPTSGSTIRHCFDAPKREGWESIDPLPFYEEVED